MNCPKCGTKLGLGARKCDVCGTEVQKNASGQREGHSIFLLAAVVTVLVAVLSGLATYGISTLVDFWVPEMRKLVQKQSAHTQTVPFQTESFQPDQMVPTQQTVPTVPSEPKTVTISYLVEWVNYHNVNKSGTRYVWEYAENWHQKTAFTVNEYYIGYNGASLSRKFIYKEKTEYMENDESASISSKITAYDDYGREIWLNTVYIDTYAEMYETKEEHKTYVYDAQGLMKQIQSEYLDIDGNILDRWTLDYQYTMQGKHYLVELADYSYLYDEEGSLLLAVKHDPKTGKETWRQERTYDTWGNLLTETTYVGGQCTSKREYIYQTVEVSEDFARRFPMFKIVD